MKHATVPSLRGFAPSAIALVFLVCAGLGLGGARSAEEAPATKPAATQPASAPPTPIRVLLLGDSTVLGSVPRLLVPKADHLEDVVRKLLAAEPGLPPVEVINKGEDADTIKRMLAGRYERDVGKLAGGPVDFVFIRYGINDRAQSDWPKAFPQAYRELIARIRRDQPRAMITLETVIPYQDEPASTALNAAIRAVAAAERLPVLDTNGRYAKELAHGPDALTYRRVPLAAIPAPVRPLLPPNAVVGADVVVLDNTLDVHLRGLPNWFADRHPNPAGYHVIGRGLAEYLAPLIRARAAAPAPTSR
ncbi:MAG: GDSL-type esterase/lipase family protein [Planctomycetota bacterium]|nr:GDSL-type esterase/lipase family protein [Planctomycetota bacterium]